MQTLSEHLGEFENQSINDRAAHLRQHGYDDDYARTGSVQLHEEAHQSDMAELQLEEDEPFGI